MTNPVAGWYPDATVPGQQRWWDGTQWTENVQATYGSPAARVAVKAPEGTSPNTIYIWLILVVFVVAEAVSIIYTLSIDYSAYMEDVMDSALNPTPGSIMSPYAQLFTPGYFISMAVAFLAYAAQVLLAFFDWRELKRRGVPSPFHWAFAFIPVFYFLVYVIGRSIVVRMRTGAGLSPMITMIALFAVSFILGIVVSFATTGNMMSNMPTYSDLDTYYGE